jgi:sulfite exporter TauE/SafE
MSNSGKNGVVQACVFGFGRVLSYVCLGLTLGYLGYIFNFVSKEITGAFVISLGVFLLLRWHPRCFLLKRINGKQISLLSGIVIGLSPCPPLLALLSLAALKKTALVGGLMGLVFGIGTLMTPLIVLGFVAGKWAKVGGKIRSVNVITSGVFLISLGIWKVVM